MMMLKTTIGRLRLLAFLEGVSLLVLLGIAVPYKYLYGNPALVKTVGPIHGVLFLLFAFNTINVAIQYKWKFSTTTYKVLLACFIPFGTFYVDRTILARMV